MSAAMGDDPDFESYVRETLAQMPANLTREQFRQRCRLDLNAGYHAEIAEAERRYFGKVRKK